MVGAVVDAAHAGARVEPTRRAQNLAIAVSRGSHHELGDLAGGQQAGIPLFQLADGLHRRQKVGVKVLGGGNGAQVLRRGALEIDGHAAGQPDCLLHVVGGDARHELQVDVASEPLLLSEPRYCLEHALLRLCGVRGARAEEKATDCALSAHLKKELDKLLRLERDAAHIAMTVDGAVAAIEPADVRKEDAQQGCATATCSGAIDPRKAGITASLAT